MKSLLRHLIRLKTWEKLPVMPRTYSVEYEPGAVDQDTGRLMQLTHTRCPQGVELLRSRHRGATAAQLAFLLPRKRRRVRPLARLASMLMRFAGTTQHDPMRAIARSHIRRGRA